MSTTLRRSFTPRRILLGIAALLLLIVVLYALWLAVPKRDYFGERHGELVESRLLAASEGDIVQKTVRLVSSSGLEVTLRLARPATEPGETLPVIIVMGGEGTGKDAVDLVGIPDGIAYVALDYPYNGDQELDAFWESIAAIPDIQQAFLDSPPAMSLALDWAQREPWFDPDRVELVGASLGVPFTAAAGALDKRFTRVWLLHGGADNTAWVMHAGRKYIDNEFLRAIATRGALLLVHGNSFRTLDWIHEIAPRPLMVVMARDDDYVPPEAQAPFVEAAESEFIELIWTDGQHIRPTRKEELQALLDVVLSRIDKGP